MCVCVVCRNMFMKFTVYCIAQPERPVWVKSVSFLYLLFQKWKPLPTHIFDNPLAALVMIFQRQTAAAEVISQPHRSYVWDTTPYSVGRLNHVFFFTSLYHVFHWLKGTKVSFNIWSASSNLDIITCVCSRLMYSSACVFSSDNSLIPLQAACISTRSAPLWDLRLSEG